MIRFAFSSVLSIVLTSVCQTAPAKAPDEYAWGWPLQTRGEAAAWRIRLDPGIVEQLTDAQARDLAVFDADGRRMPLLRIPPGRLLEVSTTTRELRFQARAHREQAQRPGADIAADDADLSLLLVRPDGTRLELRAPESDRAGQGSAVVYEALIEGPPPAEANPDPGDNGHWLVTEWTASQPLADSLDCVVKSVDQPGVQGAPLEFQTAFDTRPATMTARTRVAPLTRGWHVSCRSGTLPAGLELARARIESRQTIDHASRVEIPLSAAKSEPGVLEGEIDPPFALRRLRVSSPARNQLSSVRLLLRGGPDQDWRRHAEAELATLNPARSSENVLRQAADRRTAGQVVFDLSRQPLRRLQWRIESAPPLAEPVAVVLEARVEEWLFLAQGQPPWRLHAGSRKAPPSNPDLLAEPTLARLGPTWELPLAAPLERFEAGSAAALQAPSEPVPWTRWLLWLVLIAGSLAVAGLALRLLRNPV